MNAEELDRKFDEGGPILEYFDLSSAERSGLDTQSVSVDFPVWMVEAFDKEAKRLGIHREAVIKTWLAQLLDAKAA